MAGRNSIYEVFRACRLCGGGGGYKMPIVNLEDELDMRHKIRECVRIEVHQDDKMPPLICELCVDKVNDYFEFLEMCRSTDTRTRDRLGLPQVSQMQHGLDADCILGVTEPVFVNDDSNDAEPLARQKNRLVVGGRGRRGRAGPSPVPVVTITRTGLKDAKTGLKELRVSMNGSKDSGSSRESSSARPGRGGRRTRSPTPPPRRRTRESPREPTPPPRRRARDPTPPRARRGASPPAGRRPKRDASDEPLKKHVKHEKEKKPPPPPPKETRQKGILKVKTLVEDDKSLLREKPRPLSKRERGALAGRAADARPAKSVKIAIKPEKRPEKRRAATPPRPEAKRRAPEPPPAHACALCPGSFGKAAALASHMRHVHSPTFTLDRLACNACGEWFRGVDEAATHHRWHKSAPAPYVCRLCTAEFRQLTSYAKHFANKQCVPSREVPDQQCAGCWRLFPSGNLLRGHKCKGEDGRPGGNCAKCNRKYVTYKTLRKHESVCCKPGPKSKGGAFETSPEVLRRVTPMQVRTARCDPLLQRIKLERHYDVSHVTTSFGLDKSCVYPYISSVRSIKTEPHDYDLNNVKDELFDYEDDFANYESFTDSDSEPEMTQAPNLVPNPFARKKKTIDALSTLSIKAIFSNKFLGTKKIQRKRRRRLIIKPEIKTEDEVAEGDKEGNETFDSLLRDSVDKETKKEMIEASSKDAVVDLDQEGHKERNKSQPESEKSNDVAVVTENKDKEGSDLQDQSQGEVDKLAAQTEKMFDDDAAIDQDVSSAVDDLIAGLDDIVDDKADKGIAGLDDIGDNKADGGAKDEDKSGDKLDVKESAVKAIDSELEKSEATKERNEDNSIQEKPEDSLEEKGAESKKEEELSNKEAENKNEKDDSETNIGKTETTSNEKVSENPEDSGKDNVINNVSKVGTKDDLDDDDDFDVNSMFSGELGATALKSKGKLANIEVCKNDKLDTTVTVENKNETENPKIDIRSADKVEECIKSASVGHSSGEIKNGESLESKVREDSVSDVIDSIGADKKNCASIDKIDISEDRPIDNKLDDSNDKLDSKRSNLEKVELNEDELLKDKTSDTELENLSDTEMDDKELMDALDAQISNNTPSDTKDLNSGTEKQSENTAEKIENTKRPEEKNTEAVLGSTKEPEVEKMEIQEENKRTEGTEEQKVIEETKTTGEPKPEEKTEDKISLDDLLMASAAINASKSGDTSVRESMDLDCISDDEFNFDA